MLFSLNVWGGVSFFLGPVHMQLSSECPYTDGGKAEVSSGSRSLGVRVLHA